MSTGRNSRLQPLTKDTSSQRRVQGTRQWTQQPRPKLETFAGTFAFGVDGEMDGVGLCWYLDSNFCSNFHRLKSAMASPSAARALMLVVFIGGARTPRPTPP